MSAAVPIPLATSLMSRDGSLTLDGMIVNGYVSPAKDQTLNVHKRPGISWTQSSATGAGGSAGNGIYVNLNVLYEVRGLQFRVNGVAKGFFSGSPESSKCWFASSGLLTSPTLIVFHSESNNTIYVWDGTTFTENAISGPTAFWAGGMIYLDGTFYAMDSQGNIFGSPINAPASAWDGTNVIKANCEDGAPIGIWRLGSYIVAFSTTTATFFFDNGEQQPTGSPLRNATANFSRIGCMDADSVAELDDSLYFLSTDTWGFTEAMVLANGGGFKSISTPDVNRVFRKYPPTGSCVVWNSGDRNLYLVQLSNGGYAVFDVVTKLWYFWGIYGQDVMTINVTFTQDALDPNTYHASYANTTDTVATPLVNLVIASLPLSINAPVQSWSSNTLTVRWPLQTLGASFSANVLTYTLTSANSVSIANSTNGYLQGTNGERGVNSFSSSQDTYALLSGTTTSPGYFMVRTQTEDQGTQSLKDVEFLDIIGDRNTQAAVFLRNSDDDFNSIVATVYGDMSARYRITDFGSYQVRGYELVNVDTYPARFNSLRMQLTGAAE